jgi:hypothetical protein
VIRRASASGLLLTAGFLLAAPAGAQSDGSAASSAEVRSLAARAADDPRALTRLRAVRTIDGRPAHLDIALEGASGSALRQRLALLSGPTTGETLSGADPARAREDAAHILRARKFQPPSQPRPLRGVLRWIGHRVEPLIRPLAPVGRVLAAMWDALVAGGVWSFLAGGVIALLAGLASLRVARRRGRRLSSFGPAHGGHLREVDPDVLDRQAAEAEAAGHLDDAFRLRFLAGLIRLDRAGVVELRPSLTSGGLRRQVPSPALRHLTTTFDEIVYGGRPAEPDDVAEAHAGWRRTLEDVKA